MKKVYIVERHHHEEHYGFKSTRTYVIGVAKTRRLAERIRNENIRLGVDLMKHLYKEGLMYTIPPAKPKSEYSIYPREIIEK